MALMEIFAGKRLRSRAACAGTQRPTSRLPIRRMPFAPMLVVPLSQHTGAPAFRLCVKARKWCAASRSQRRADLFRCRCMRPPRDAWRIALAPSARGDLSMAIYIEPYQGASQEILYGAPQDIGSMTPEEIVQAVQDTGVVGLGGAAFPTHVKLKVPEGKKIDTVVVNGCECEPYLTTDHRVMLEQPAKCCTARASR
jgi:electron transport complex protein RnfC